VDGDVATLDEITSDDYTHVDTGGGIRDNGPAGCVGLLTHRTGVDAEHSVQGTEPDQPRQQWHQSSPTPGSLGTDENQAQDGEPRDDANGPVDASLVGETHDLCSF
jgi:hypothetical protein